MTTSNSSNKNGPSTLADRALKAWHQGGMIFITMKKTHIGGTLDDFLQEDRLLEEVGHA